MTAPGGRVRKVPMRTCVGCRQVRPKRELLRIVRTQDGAVRFDPTGKVSGRGAYVCPARACLEAARRGGHLSRVLEQPVSDAVFGNLATYLDGLGGGGTAERRDDNETP